MVARIRETLSCRNVVILVAGLIALCAIPEKIVENDHSALYAQSEGNDAATKKGRGRVREGSMLEGELGEFRESGERIRFYLLKDDKTSYGALENLALDRVSRVLDENTTPRTWAVTGVITEYRSGNFLLVTRAKLKRRSDKTTPRN
jgi:hypothetical protein